MTKRLAVPTGLDHLIEKRERDRRAAQQAKTAAANGKSTKERRKTDRRRK